MPFLSINNANFYYALHGQGQPVMLISGYTRDHTAWTSVLNDLSPYFRLVLLDNRGVGQTQDNGQALSVELMAADVMQVAKALKLHKPHIVGHSMGGTIAQTIAANYPEEIGKLVLLATSAKWREAMLLGLRSNLNLREKNCDIDTQLAATLPWVFGETFLSEPSNIALFKKLALSNPYPQALADQQRQYEVLKQFDGREQLKNITAPTLVVYGQEDLLTLPQESIFLAEHIQQAKLVALPAAHALMVEAGKTLATELLEFLAE